MNKAVSPSSISEPVLALFRDYLLPMKPTETVGRFLDASFDSEAQAPRLTEIIENNPLYAHYLEKLDILQAKVQKWREDFPLEQGTGQLTQFIVALLGPVTTRNAILSIWVNRFSAPGLPRKVGVPFVLSPRQQLKYGISILDYCGDHAIPDSHLAYMSGVCFDWTAALMDLKGGPVKTEKKILDEIWPEAVRAARLAYELAAIPSRLELSPYAFSATLLVYLGKVLMAAAFPKKDPSTESYRDFLKHCSSHGNNTEAAILSLESTRFAFTHAEVAGLCSLVRPVLRPAFSAILRYQEPYLLQKQNRDSFYLGSIIRAAVILARTKQVATLTPAHKAWLARIPLTEADLQSAVKRAADAGGAKK